MATGRFGTDKAGYAAMRKTVDGVAGAGLGGRGCNGAGRPLAQRLLADGEQVVDVPAKLSARARLFDTGHNRKTDAHDAHAVAVVAVRTKGLRVLSYDDELEVLRMLADRRDELTRQRVQTVNRLHRLLSELIPGQAKKDLTALQAKAILASVRPRDLAGKTRRRLAAEQLTELVAIEKKIKASTKELKTMVLARGSTLMDLPGVGPAGRRPDPGRRRRRRPVRRPQPVRVLDRHRTPGRLLRRADPAPAVAGREPQDEPRAPHRRGQPDPPRHPRPGLLPAQARRRQDPDGSHALPETTDLRRRLPPARRRRPARQQPGPPVQTMRAREGTAGRL